MASRIVQLGMAYDAQWADVARAEMAENPRYQWQGELPGWEVSRALARAPLFDPARERQAWHDVLQRVIGEEQPAPTGFSAA